MGGVRDNLQESGLNNQGDAIVFHCPRIQKEEQVS